jgi:predicted SAM-dependent methyltransferase
MRKTKTKTIDPHAPQKVVIEQPARELKLDLGSGNNPREGFEGVDLYAEKATHKVNLMAFPWQWADNSVSELHCSHFVEHLPMVYVSAKGGEHADGPSVMPGVGRVDLLIRFFNECHRILKPDAHMTVIVPSLRSSRAFQDPTHRRFIAGETVLYLSKQWREMNGLEHYLGATCDFGVEAFPTIAPNLGLELLSPEPQSRRIQHEWNTTSDFHMRLKTIKAVPK